MCKTESPVNRLFSGAIQGFCHRLGRGVKTALGALGNSNRHWRKISS
jgi:hypothetical protein